MVGWVMMTDDEYTQLLLSVTVKVYEPADKPEAVEPVPPEGLQLYV